MVTTGEYDPPIVTRTSDNQSMDPVLSVSARQVSKTA
jgi:hypothetical protein